MQTRLSDKEVVKLYDIYSQYEDWKNNEGCYDLMDVVNYIIRALESDDNLNNPKFT